MTRLLPRSSASTLCAALVAITGYSSAWPTTLRARAADDARQVERQTLDAALLLAGKSLAKLPIGLVSMVPDFASTGIEGWTAYRPDGKAERIFVFTGSAIFRCASVGENYQCLLRLSSTIVHEAWHFSHGGSEEGAYAAQIAFLMGNQGELNQIASVRMARDRSVDAQRKAIEAARRLSRDPVTQIARPVKTSYEGINVSASN